MEPSRLPTVLAAFDGPWWVAGGVAIELFCGHWIRDHLDIDVEILRGDAARLHAALPGWELHAAHRGRLSAWTPELPLHANSLWARPGPGAPWAVQFLLAAATNTSNGAQRWAYRRDPRITYDLAQVGWIAHGASVVSVQQPELVLLFKSAAPRPQDDHDLSHAADLLTTHQRRWLRHAIRLAHPDSKWNRLL